MNDRVLPTFKDATEQAEWFLQAGLRSRIESGIPDSDTRGRITITPKYTGLDILNRSFTIIIDDNPDIDQILEEVFIALCNSGFKEEELRPRIVLNGARGNNFGSVVGPYSAYSTNILVEVKQKIEFAQSAGYLTPKNVEFKPEFLAQFENRADAIPSP